MNHVVQHTEKREGREEELKSSRDFFMQKPVQEVMGSKIGIDKKNKVVFCSISHPTQSFFSVILHFIIPCYSVYSYTHNTCYKDFILFSGKIFLKQNQN